MWTRQMATENISIWELTDHGMSRLSADLCLGNTLTYLLIKIINNDTS